MKENRSFHHGNLRNEMIEQGMEIIKNEGIINISLKEIANKCGVSSPSTYRHFRDKQDLIEILFSKISGIFNEYITIENTITLPKERLIKMGVNFVYFSKEYPYYYEFLFQSPYAISLKMKNGSFELSKSQDGFNLFKKEVSRYLNYFQIDGDVGQHVLNLWAYVSGLSMIVSEKNSPFISKELIQEQLENMLIIYTTGNTSES